LGIKHDWPSTCLMQLASNISDMAYKTATICFWSGTGNSYRVSNWLGKIADNRGLKTRIISLEKAKSEKLLSAGKESFIAIVFPTHGFTAPWHVLKTVWKLPQGNGSYFLFSNESWDKVWASLYPWN